MSDSVKRFIIFGQVFVSGRVQVSDGLTATIGGVIRPVQMDALANWPDGSVKLASLAFQVPSLCAGSQVPVMLTKTGAPDVAATPVDLTSGKPSLIVRLDFTAGSYAGSQTVDLGAALQAALASKPDYWLRGPLVTQARVDVPLADGQSANSSTLHLTADVSKFADGSAVADVQFNNDIVTVIPKSGSVNPQPPLPALGYTATINFQGVKAVEAVSQVQYTNWHIAVWSSTSPQFNVQHDISQLQTTGAILPYDLSTGVNNSLLQNYDKNILQKTGFGLPLAANGITTYMPSTGGRPDIGYTTQYNTSWLMTQDARVAKLAIAQSDTSGAIPWNYKLASGHWLTPAEDRTVWTDARGGPHGYTDGIANIADSSVWVPENSHQPNLNYVPYLMTGMRWNLDRLNAQAAFNLAIEWPGSRCKTPKCNTLFDGSDQVRGQAWGFRELKQASFVARPGSYELEIFSQTVVDNWSYVQTQQPVLSLKQGEATGWLPGNYGNPGATAAWQQDFLTGIAVMSALMGDADARQFVAWQRPWLTGRFIGKGMNPYDGCNYNLMVMDPTNDTYINSWAAIEAATIAANMSNGTSWIKSDSYYCAVAMSVLSGALILAPADSDLQAALTWLKNSGAPYTDQSSFRIDPTFNIVKAK